MGPDFTFRLNYWLEMLIAFISDLKISLYDNIFILSLWLNEGFIECYSDIDFLLKHGQCVRKLIPPLSAILISDITVLLYDTLSLTSREDVSQVLYLAMEKVWRMGCGPPEQRGWQTASRSHMLWHMSSSHRPLPARPHVLSIGCGRLEWVQTEAGMGRPEGAWLHSVMAGEDVSSIQPLLGSHEQGAQLALIPLFELITV